MNKDNTIAALKDITPSNFAFTMATGVISIVFHNAGWFTLSWLFLTIGLLGYIVLVALFLTRLMFFKSKVLSDFKDILKMFKYLTFSAGSNALAVALCIKGYHFFGLILGIVGIISTIVLTYSLFCTFFFHSRSPIEAVSPFWLLLAIACNSSGIAITCFWEKLILQNQAFLLLAFCFWTFGVFIYAIFMTLNMYRMCFFSVNGKDLDPCYWTCMGAAAIAVADGSQFILVHHPPLFLEAIRPFMEGSVLFLWAWGTAWIPILCLMELWKFFYFKIPFHYQPSRWGMVFPLGMYTLATDVLHQSVHLDILQKIVPVLLWIAFLAWCLIAYMSRLNPLYSDKNPYFSSQNK